MTNDIRLLAISGSLRHRSSNTEVLRALALLAPPWVTVTQYEGLATLPAFNPDLDGEDMTPPTAVQDLRSQLANADAVVICSPEYAHGVPGSLKNALDWLVSVPDMVHKPTALVNASQRSTHAQLSLAETVRTMSMHLVAEPLRGPAGRSRNDFRGDRFGSRARGSPARLSRRSDRRGVSRPACYSCVAAPLITTFCG